MLGAAALVGALVSGAGAAVYGAATASSGVITACVREGAIRIVSSTSACTSVEAPLQWNQQGPQGLQGPPGPQGVAGPAGPSGTAGLVTAATAFDISGPAGTTHSGGIPCNPPLLPGQPPTAHIATGGGVSAAPGVASGSIMVDETSPVFAPGGSPVGWSVTVTNRVDLPAGSKAEAWVICTSQP